MINTLRNTRKIVFYFALISFSITLYCCDKNNEKEKYFPSGNIEHIKEDSLATYYYDSTKTIVYKKIFHLSQNDSVIIYYKNGQIFKTGSQDALSRKYGNWKWYTVEGNLSEVREYFIIKNKSIINRQWYFSKKGDTIWYANKFNRYHQKEFEKDTLSDRNSSMIRFDFFSKDTIDINEPFAASVICNSPLGREYNSNVMMLLGQESRNFNENFSNENEVIVDTFRNLLYDKQNRINFPKANPESYRYIVVFGKYFKKTGTKTLRGYMLEYFDVDENNINSKVKRKVYFEKKIFVINKEQG